MTKTIFTLLVVISSVSLRAQSIDTTNIPKYERETCFDKSKEDYQKSIDYYSAYTKENPEDLEAFYNLAMSHYKMVDSTNWEKSIIVWNYIISKEPCFNYALHNRGLCKFFLKNTQGACSDLKKALQCEYPVMEETEKTYVDLCK